MSSSRTKQLFLEALELPAAERADFLDRACAGDAALRAQVARLLQGHERAGDVFGEEAPAAPATIDLQSGDSVGSYLLGEELGVGGFGVVFRATQEQPVRRQVALKIIKLGMDTRSVIARFELERQALALMDHPNIARVFDAGATSTGRPYFVMELVEGVPITEHCEREGLGIEERLELLGRAARAVQHAHQRGVLHRDIKPSNVLVCDVDGKPQPKVIDFGIAKATGELESGSSFQTGAGFLLGTPAYMSPEQTEGALDIDTRTDVYSLGVLLYELVSGVLPFDVAAEGLPAVFHKIREVDPPRPSTRRRSALESGETSVQTRQLPRDLARELDWIVMRCLEKERDRRYASAHDLADDIERFLNHEPLEAASPSTWYRARKLMRRHRAATFAVGGIAAALVLGTIGTSVGLLRAERMNLQLDTALGDATAANEQLDVALGAMEAANVELDHALGETEEANKQLDLALVDARRQTAIAEAVNSFLIQDLLGAARPTGEAGRGPSMPVSELLRIAAAELDVASRPGGRFADEPLVEASLRYTIGMTYDTLGVFAEASRHMQRCVDLRGEVLGESDVTRLMALSYLGMYRRREGALEEALEIHAEAFELLQQTLGLADIDTLTAAARFAMSLRAVGRRGEATLVLEDAVPVARRALGERAPVVTDLCASLAVLYADEGRYAESEELYYVVLEAQIEIFGEQSPVVLNAKMNLATLARGQGQFEDSEALYREVLETQRRVEGPEHPHTLTTLLNLAECLVSVERFDEADELLAEFIPVVERVYGPQHRRTLLWLSTRAGLLERIDRPEQAEALRRAVHERSRAALGPRDPATLEAAVVLARLYVRLGELEQASSLLEGVGALDGDALARALATWITGAGELAEAYRGAGELERAERWEQAAAERGAAAR